MILSIYFVFLEVPLILSPGLITFLMIEHFTISKQMDFKKSTVYVIVLNILLFFFANLSNQWIGFKIDSGGHLLSFHDSLEFTGLVFILALILGFIFTYIINKKYIYKLMPSNIVSKLEVWDDFFSIKRTNAHVVIRDLENKIMYYGTIKHYSMATEQQVWALHLVNITVFDVDNTNKNYDIKELYLPFNTKSMTIEFPKIKQIG